MSASIITTHKAEIRPAQVDTTVREATQRKDLKTGLWGPLEFYMSPDNADRTYHLLKQDWPETHYRRVRVIKQITTVTTIETLAETHPDE